MKKKLTFYLFTHVFYASTLRSECFSEERAPFTPTRRWIAPKGSSIEFRSLGHFHVFSFKASQGAQSYLLVSPGLSYQAPPEPFPSLLDLFLHTPTYDCSAHFFQTIANLKTSNWGSSPASWDSRQKHRFKNLEFRFRQRNLPWIISPVVSCLPLHAFSGKPIYPFGAEWERNIWAYVKISVGFQAAGLSEGWNGYLRFSFKETKAFPSLWKVASLTSQVNPQPQPLPRSEPSPNPEGAPTSQRHPQRPSCSTSGFPPNLGGGRTSQVNPQPQPLPRSEPSPNPERAPTSQRHPQRPSCSTSGFPPNLGGGLTSQRNPQPQPLPRNELSPHDEGTPTAQRPPQLPWFLTSGFPPNPEGAPASQRHPHLPSCSTSGFPPNLGGRLNFEVRIHPDFGSSSESSSSESSSEDESAEELNSNLTRSIKEEAERVQIGKLLHNLLERLFKSTSEQERVDHLRKLDQLLSDALDRDAETIREILTQRNRKGEVLLHVIPMKHFVTPSVDGSCKEDFSLFIQLLRKGFSRPVDLETLFFYVESNLLNTEKLRWERKTLFAYLEHSAPSSVYFSCTRKALFGSLIELASNLSPSSFLRLLNEKPGRVYNWAVETKLLNSLLKVWNHWLEAAETLSGPGSREILDGLKKIVKSRSPDGNSSTFQKVVNSCLYGETDYDLKSFLEFCKAALGAQPFRRWLSEESSARAVWEPKEPISLDKAAFSGIRSQEVSALLDRAYQIAHVLNTSPDLYKKEFFSSLPQEFQRSILFDRGKSKLPFTAYLLKLLHLGCEIDLELNRRLGLQGDNPHRFIDKLRAFEGILTTLNTLPAHERMTLLIEAGALCRGLSDKPWEAIPCGLHPLFFGWLGEDHERDHVKAGELLMKVHSWVQVSRSSAVSYAHELGAQHNALKVSIMHQACGSLKVEEFLDSVWKGLFQSEREQESLLEVLIGNFFAHQENLKRALEEMEALDQTARKGWEKRLEEDRVGAAVHKATGSLLTLPHCKPSFAEQFLLKKEEGKRHWLKKAVVRWKEEDVRATFFKEGAWFHGKELETYLR